MSKASDLQEQVLDILVRLDADLIRFARALVATPSINPPGNESLVVGVVEEELRRLGLTAFERIGKEVERPNLLVHVSVPGLGMARSLMLCGHLDTKPPGELTCWKHDPFGGDVIDGELWGLGAGDMKGAVAAMVYAAAAIQSVTQESTGSDDGLLTLALTADEEAGSSFGCAWLAKEGLLSADAAIIGEPCGIEREWEAINLVSRGIALFRVVVHGTQMHSSLSDRVPSVNATVAMGRLAALMHDELKGRLTYLPHSIAQSGPTVNVGVVARAGAHYGVYPGRAELECDIRTIPGMTRESLERDIKAFLITARQRDPTLSCELEMEMWVPPCEIAPAERVVQSLRRAAENQLRIVPPFGVFPGATDAPFLTLGASIPTVPAFGPGYLTKAHRENEALPVKSICTAARIYALTALDFLADQW